MRILVPVPNPYNPNKKIRDWSDIALDYLRALKDLPLRAISFAGGGDFAEESPWSEVMHLFVARFGDVKTNIVIGFTSGLEKAVTVGMHNIIITGSFPRPYKEGEARATLRGYDEIWCIDEDSAADLRLLGYNPKVVTPATVVKELNAGGHITESLLP